MMKSKLIFAFLFVVLGFIALQIPINTLAGSRVKFTLFDLFAPISGAFLGSAFGIGAVALMQLINLITHGFGGVDNSSALKLTATLRFLPMIFAVWYFSLGRKSNILMLLAPALSMILFNLHPIGRQVWFYSLFWLIPFLVWPFRERFLIARSLGATMTAHSVGGAMWIWAFNLPVAVWIGLIPVVILERSIFALGISASYILMNNVLAIIARQKILTGVFSFDKKYVIKILR